MNLSKATKVAIGQRVRETREQKNLTQEEIAKQVGITASYFARIERGEENPSLAVLQKIVEVLKIKSSDILPF